MASVPVPNVAEIEVRGTLNGIPIENTLYAQLVGAITNIVLQALAVAIEDWFIANVLPSLGSGYVFKEVYAHDLSSGSGLNGLSNTHGGDVGPAGGGTLPGNVAWVVKFVTGLAGRSFRGRNYIAGFTETPVTDNSIAIATANAFLGAYRMLLGGGGILPSGWTWGVVSRQHLGAPRVTGLFTPITNVSYTDLKIDTQRKRLV